MITVRDRRLSILTLDSIDRRERILRLINVEEQDQGLYRCIQGDTTLNEVLLDVLGKDASIFIDLLHVQEFCLFLSSGGCLTMSRQKISHQSKTINCASRFFPSTFDFRLLMNISILLSSNHHDQ